MSGAVTDVSLQTEAYLPPMTPPLADPGSPARTDHFLQRLVLEANGGSSNPHITLVVQGMLVSGMLIGGKEYFEAYEAEFFEYAEAVRGQPLEPDVKSSWGDLFSEMKLVYGQPSSEIAPPSYIHLSDARFFQPGAAGIPANRGVLWRGLLCQVGGFSLGFLSTDRQTNK